MRGSGARLVTTAIVAASRFPFPQSLQKSGNSNREAHQLSRFREHQTACSCLIPRLGDELKREQPRNQKLHAFCKAVESDIASTGAAQQRTIHG
jgi:hypothetical protein